MTYDALLRKVSKIAIENDKEVEAIKLLMMELSKLDAHQFYMNLKQEVPADFEEEFINKSMQYIINHIPVQHILGYAFFFGYKFTVNQHVLIPRVETEQLVENTLYYYDKYFGQKNIKLLDLGTGSGCIGVTLAKEETNLDVMISDVSFDALEVAKQNAVLLNVNVSAVLSSWFENINGKFDIIISNPPYIPDDEIVEDIVQKEPEVALYGGKNGTDFYELILKEIKPFLKEKALIGFEHGYQQKELIASYAKTYFPDAKLIQLKDFQGKDRMTFIGIGGVLEDE
ncbi:MAG: peptide chain release factor N(5)-glutamine methyltransferase [Acholeplasmataceae bacterium]